MAILAAEESADKRTAELRAKYGAERLLRFRFHLAPGLLSDDLGLLLAVYR
jgi:hypothetical protein